MSRVDGHLTAGSFAFGVQTPVTGTAAAAAASGVGAEQPVAGRGRWDGPSSTPAWPPCRARRGSAACCSRPPAAVVAVAGGRGMDGRGPRGGGPGSRPADDRRGCPSVSSSGRASAGRRSGGRSASWRAGVGILAGPAPVVADGAGLVAAGTLVTIVAHVESGHAAAAAPPWVMIGLQALHVVAMAVWIGGLAALLVGLGRRPAPSDGRRRRRARRFSAVAGVAVAVLVVTGVVRAIDEVDGWAGRCSTPPTAGSCWSRRACWWRSPASGAVNRYRHVPAAGRSLTGLRRVGHGRGGGGRVVFVVTGLLTTSPPPATAKVTEPAVVVTASDFGTTVRARLTVSPGQAGPEPVHRPPDGLRLRRSRWRPPGSPPASPFPPTPRVSPSTLDAAADRPRDLRRRRGQPHPPRPVAGDARDRPGGRLARARPRPRHPYPAGAGHASRPGSRPSTTVALGQGRTVQVYADPERPGTDRAPRHLLRRRRRRGAGGQRHRHHRRAPPPRPAASARGTSWPTSTPPPARGRWRSPASPPSGDYLYAPLDLEIPNDEPAAPACSPPSPSSPSWPRAAAVAVARPDRPAPPGPVVDRRPRHHRPGQRGHRARPAP